MIAHGGPHPLSRVVSSPSRMAPSRPSFTERELGPAALVLPSSRRGASGWPTRVPWSSPKPPRRDCPPRVLELLSPFIPSASWVLSLLSSIPPSSRVESEGSRGQRPCRRRTPPASALGGITLALTP